MQLFDLSHRLNSSTPVYPGKKPPIFKPSAFLEKDGYRETLFNFESHLGTHIDAPAHMVANGKFLDQLPLESFCGKALIINIPANTPHIGTEHLQPFANQLKDADFVLFHTGWHKFWNSENYFYGFPVLTSEAVTMLLTFSLKGTGFDAISADPVDSRSYENHMAILGHGMLIIENLIFPELTINEGFFSCYPLPCENADGSPVRAVLQV